MGTMTSSDTRAWSFALLLAGGVLILLGGATSGWMMGAGWHMGWMMGGYVPSVPLGFAWWTLAWGLATGAAVLVAAVRVRDARDTTTWGIVAVVAGALSLLAMGGWLLGALASIVGGALAIGGSPTTGPRAPPQA